MDSELIRVIVGINSYLQYIMNGKLFVNLSDSLSFTYSRNLSFEKSPRLARYSILLQNLDYRIEHIAGVSNTIPDFLSRHIPDNDTTKEVVVPNSILDVDHFDFLNTISFNDHANNDDSSLKSNGKAA